MPASPTTTYYTFDLDDGETAGLLRRSPGSIQVVSGGKWVVDPDGLGYFEEFGGLSLDLIELTVDAARAKATELGVSLDEGGAERG
jgi:hypothetical protein